MVSADEQWAWGLRVFLMLWWGAARARGGLKYNRAPLEDVRGLWNAIQLLDFVTFGRGFVATQVLLEWLHMRAQGRKPRSPGSVA